MSYNLYLDDIRTPKEDGWIVVRNFAAFTSVIRTKGNPDVISFDHDLGEDMHQYRLMQGIYSKRKSRSLKKLELTGYDCAKWYVDFAHKNKWAIPAIIVHSMNPVGADNIRSLFINYKPSI